MAKGNWSKYNPKPRCFFCDKALGKKAIRHNPGGRVACESHATQHSAHPTGGTPPALKPLHTPEVNLIEKFFSVPPTSG
jgi:hypothetical protein